MSNGKNLDRIFQDGVLVDLDIGWWRGTKRLTAEDIGFEEGEVADPFNLGTKRLIPDEAREKIRRIESQARYALDRTGFSFPVAKAKFVPRSALAGVDATLRDLRTQFEAERDAFLASYEEHKETMRPQFHEASEVAYEKSGRKEDPKEFLSRFLGRIEAAYPPANRLARKFFFDWTFFTVSLSAGGIQEVSTEELEELSRKANQAVDSFVGEVVEALRAETVKVCDRVAEQIKGGKAVTERSLKSLRNFVDRFRSLNFVGDQRIEEQLDRLRCDYLEGTKAAEVKDNVIFQEKLANRLSFIVKFAQDINDISEVTGSYRRKLDLEPATEVDVPDHGVDRRLDLEGGQP